MWRDLVEVARWAPSPHNMQPWNVRALSAAEAELLVDPSRLLPETDPVGAFMTVALGVFVETLAVAAHANGRELEVELVGEVDPRSTARPVFAHLRLVDGAPADRLSPQLVLDRRTSRVPYDGRAVAPDVLAELGAVAAAFDHVLETSSDAALVEWIVDLNREMLFHDLTDAVARSRRFSERILGATTTADLDRRVLPRLATCERDDLHLASVA